MYQDEPVAIFEVLSRSTRRIDDGEKKEAYLTIPSLSVYALIEQDFPGAVVYRRTTNGFVREVLSSIEAILPIPEIDAELPLAEIYDGVAFAPEVGNENA
jgi:Uma2 family endonuclease